MLYSRFPFIFTLATTSLISACGGGGSSGGDDGGGQNPTYSIGGTVTGNHNPGLTLENNGGDTLEVAGASFEFPGRLANGSDYAVTVARPPEHQLCSVDNAGGTVAGSDVENVEVQCRYWRTATLIEADDMQSNGPQVASDGAGNAIVIWEQYDSTLLKNNILASSYSPVNGWGPATPVETDAGSAADPQIAFDGAGNAIAVWRQYIDGTASILANTWSPGNGWGTATSIENDDAGPATYPQIAVDDAGNAVAVWLHGDGERDNIQANTYTPDSGWGTATLIETDNAGDAEIPGIAFDGAGNAIAIWHQHDGTRNNIQANIWSPGSGWGTPAPVEADAGSATYPRIAADGAGKAIAVWKHSDGGQDSIRANSWSSGSGWGTPVPIGTGDVDLPQIAVDGSGNAVAVWESGDGGQANTYSPGAGWGTPELIETDDAGRARYPRVAVDGGGNAIAVWQHDSDDGQKSDIQANTWSPGSGWSTATLIETDDAGKARFPKIAIDAAGNAIVVWQHSDGSRNNIQANRFE